MNSIRLALLVCAAGVASPVFAQGIAPAPSAPGNPAAPSAPGDAAPFALAKSYSAEQIVTTRNGQTISTKIYVDDGRMRSDMTMQGMDVSAIILPAKQKIYSVMPSQGVVMVMPYDPDKYSKYMIGTPGFTGKFDLVGPDAADGVPCQKYKVMVKDKTYFLWVDPAKKLPVKMAAEDGSYTAIWKNYQPGPQAASLFEVPAGYQMMDMSAMPSTPGGGAGGMPGP